MGSGAEERKTYAKFTYTTGAHCLFDPSRGELLEIIQMEVAEREEFKVEFVEMTVDEFNDLPEFEGP